VRRGLWFVAGAGAGVYGMVRVRRLKEALTREGLSDRWHAVALGARMFRDEVAQGHAEAETQLRERYGLVPHGRRELVGAERTARSAGSSAELGSTGPKQTREGDS
jgi:hypothetical protein